MAACMALERLASTRRDAARIVLEAPEVLDRSPLHAHLADTLAGAGLPPAEAADAATMLVHVLTQAKRAGPATTADPVAGDGSERRCWPSAPDRAG
jgi:hypothetical protein